MSFGNHEILPHGGALLPLHVTPEEAEMQDKPSHLGVSNDACLRLISSLVAHLLGFLSQICLIVVFVFLRQWFFLALALCLKLLVSAFCTIAAMSDKHLKHRVLSVPAIIGYPLVFLIFGILQGAQVKHILDLYKYRSSSSVDHEFRGTQSKTFDGIIEGIPFAIISIWSLWLVRSDETCPWYIHKLKYHMVLRSLFAITGGWALMTVALGMLEVDYRVGAQARRRIEKSIIGTGMHVAYRTAEATFQVSMWCVLFVFLRPVMLSFSGVPIVLFEYFVFPSLIFFALLAYIWVLACARPTGAPRESVFALALVAVSMIACDPARFVDSPGYIEAARRTRKLLFRVRVAEFLVIFFVVAISFFRKFPASCHVSDNSERIGHQYLLAHQDGPYLQVGFVLVALARLVSWIYFLRVATCDERRITDSAVLEMIPCADSCEQGAVVVRGGAVRGFSSHLLRVGVGLVSTLVMKEEPQIGDYEIERVIGRGAYGVVVVVCQRSGRMSADGQAIAKRYAMKLQNSGGKQTQNGINILPTKTEMASRERDCMQQLKHPFIVRLEYFFEVPDRLWKDTSTGEVIKDSNQNTRFHKAIVMEYCPEGDLENYIIEHALPEGTIHPHEKPLINSDVQWICLMRRFGAEMCEALAFIHEKGLAYRDLKPQNVLLRTGSDQELHIKFTDFGFSKQLGGSSPASAKHSLAGSPIYAAPEVMQIMTQGRAEYTLAVDLYSLGKTILAMLWRTKIHACDLQMPESRDYCSDQRVPPFARSMIEQLTSSLPVKRGIAADLRHQHFFGEVQLSTYDSEYMFIPIDWGTLGKHED